MIRIGRVTNVYPNGRLKVAYEDTENTSLPISMLTFNREYSMPKVGERVVTLHMGNGSSKGFVLGTYYDGGGISPIASSGYKKEMDGSTAECQNGNYKLKGNKITLESEGQLELVCSYESTTLENLIKRIERLERMIGSGD